MRQPAFFSVQYAEIYDFEYDTVNNYFHKKLFNKVFSLTGGINV